jgi:hypothetical protein
MKGVPGVPSVGTLQKFWKKRPLFLLEKEEREEKEEGEERSLKVIVLEKDHPDSERLWALALKMQENIHQALLELQNELKRLSGGVIASDHVIKDAPDYCQLYSLKPNKELVQRLMDELSDSSDDDDFSSGEE